MSSTCFPVRIAVDITGVAEHSGNHGFVARSDQQWQHPGDAHDGNLRIKKQGKKQTSPTIIVV